MPNFRWACARWLRYRSGLNGAASSCAGGPSPQPGQRFIANVFRRRRFPRFCTALLKSKQDNKDKGVAEMIYYDITDLLNYFKVYTQVTGIQRVTIEIIKEFVNLAENNEKFGLITFHQDVKRPMATDPAFFQKEELSGEQICAYFGLPISGKSG
jgi:hypothetical protein